MGALGKVDRIWDWKATAVIAIIVILAVTFTTEMIEGQADDFWVRRSWEYTTTETSTGWEVHFVRELQLYNHRSLIAVKSVRVPDEWMYDSNVIHGDEEWLIEAMVELEWEYLE